MHCNKTFLFLTICRLVSVSAGKMDIGGKIHLSLDYIEIRYRNWKGNFAKDSDKDFWVILGDFWRKDYLKYIVSYRKFIRTIEIPSQRAKLNFRNEISLECHFISLEYTMTKYKNIFGACVLLRYKFRLFIFKTIFILAKTYA